MLAARVANDLRVLYLGVALSELGAIEVPINPALVGASMRHVLADADPRLSIVAPGFHEQLVAALPDGSAGRIVEIAPEGAAEQVTGRLPSVDEEDRPLPAGETGEIVVSSDEPWSTFSGYWNQPETSLEVMRNFGLHTGDAGYLDEDGYLWYVDRIKDMIRRRGENVAAQTVEEAVHRAPGVVEVAAYPVPSEHGEEEIAVAVMVKPDSGLTPERIVDTCRAELPRFAVPRYVRLVDALPMTETGKIQKFRLKQEGVGDAHDFPECR